MCLLYCSGHSTSSEQQSEVRDTGHALSNDTTDSTTALCIQHAAGVSITHNVSRSSAQQRQ
jgi:hypothetical protein